MDRFPRDPASFYLDRADSTTSRHDFARRDSASRQGDYDNTTGLKRQQSIRFAGPSARPRRVLASRASEQHLPSASSAARLNSDMEMRRARSSLSEHRDSTFSSTLVSPLHALTLDQGSERYTEGDGRSLRSVNHKLRKSRSMYTTPEDEYYFDNSIEKSRQTPRSSRYATLNKENKPLPPTPSTMGLRAPKSMSFLRSSRREQTSSSSRAENDLAVQLAREKFREQVKSQSRLKTTPSMFFRSKARRTDSSIGLRKSLRNSSNNTALSSAFSGDTLQISKDGSLRKTARKVSKSLKSKIKGLFRKSSGSSASQAPARDSDDESLYNLMAHPPVEDASISRGPSRIAELHSVPPSQQIKSCQGSIASCDGEDIRQSDERSRVTSWTDSVANTVTSQSAFGDWERQRLSVIKENGMHVSSSTLNRPTYSNTASPGVLAAPVTVDSQRVYSALMKRIEESQQMEDLSRKQSVEEIRSYGRPPVRGSSVDQIATEPWSPPTIRCVDSDEDDVFQDKHTETGHQKSDGSVVQHQQRTTSATSEGSQGAGWSPLSASEV